MTDDLDTWFDRAPDARATMIAEYLVDGYFDVDRGRLEPGSLIIRKMREGYRTWVVDEVGSRIHHTTTDDGDFLVTSDAGAWMFFPRDPRDLVMASVVSAWLVRD